MKTKKQTKIEPCQLTDDPKAWRDTMIVFTLLMVGVFVLTMFVLRRFF